MEKAFQGFIYGLLLNGFRPLDGVFEKELLAFAKRITKRSDLQITVLTEECIEIKNS